MPIRRILALLVGATMPLLFASVALAHAVIQPSNAPAGEVTRFQLLIPHGCAPGEPPPPPGTVTEPTRLISVEVPDGATVTEVEPAPGFTESIGDGELLWEGGALESGDPGAFYFTATLEGADGDQLVFNVYQECTDELSYRWTEGSDETPAPVVAVGAEAAGGHDMADMDESESEMADIDHSEDEMADDIDHSDDEMAMDASEDAMTEGMDASEDTSDMASSDMDSSETASDEPTDPATETVEVSDGGGVGTGGIVAGAVALAAVLGGLFVVRGRKDDDAI